MEKKNPYLNLYLGALKKPWSDYCKAMGKKPGAALKEAIEQQLEKAAKNRLLPPLRQTGEAPDDEPKVRFEILMTKSEKAAVQERANLSGAYNVGGSLRRSGRASRTNRSSDEGNRGTGRVELSAACCWPKSQPSS